MKMHGSDKAGRRAQMRAIETMLLAVFYFLALVFSLFSVL